MDIGVKMTETVENGQVTEQNNSEKSENTQQNTEINTQAEDNSTSENTENDTATAEENTATAEDDGELPIPEPDIAEDENKDKKAQPGWLKRKLERDRRKEAEKEAAINAEAARLRQENEILKATVKNPQTPNQPPAIDPYMPQREQYNSEGEYFMALTDYRDNRRQQEALFHQRQATIRKHEEKYQDNLKEAIETGKGKYKDFEEKTDYILFGEGFPSNRAMGEAIVESKYKDDILYFLGTHVEEAERIANLPPVIAAKEIAKIEVRLESKKKSNITKAPKVLTPLAGGGGGSATHGDPNKMGMDEFRQWYEDKYGSR